MNINELRCGALVCSPTHCYLLLTHLPILSDKRRATFTVHVYAVSSEAMGRVSQFYGVTIISFTNKLLQAYKVIDSE